MTTINNYYLAFGISVVITIVIILTIIFGEIVVVSIFALVILSILFYFLPISLKNNYNVLPFSDQAITNLDTINNLNLINNF